MIELIDLRNEVPEGFRKLIDDDVMNILLDGGCVALGITEDEVPVAACVADPGEDGVGEILSIYVIPEKRRDGYGTEILFDTVNMLYDYDNMFSVKASFAESEEENGLKGFFEYMGFEFEKDETMGSFSFSVADMASSDKVKGDIDKRVTGFKDVLTSTKNALAGKHGAIPRYRGLGEIDEELSCIVDDKKKDPEDVSCLVVGRNKNDNVLDIVWAYANENTLDFIHMLRFAVVRALKKYGKDMTIRAPFINETSKKLLEKLLCGKQKPIDTVWNVTYYLDWEPVMDPETEKSIEEAYDALMEAT